MGVQQKTMNYTSTSLKYVDHTYHDFSNYIIEGGELTKHKKSDNNFPARLHKLISDVNSNDVITWMVSLLVILYTHGRIAKAHNMMCSFLIPSRTLYPPYSSLTAVRGRSSTKNVSYPRSFPTITFVRSMNRSPANWMVGALNVYIKLGLVRVRVFYVCVDVMCVVLYVLLNNILT